MTLGWLRHCLAIALLPFMVAVVIPYWIAAGNGSSLTLGSSVGQIAFQTLGAVLLVIGFYFFISSLRRFAGEGEGTLAPWDPPRRLVVRGPYRYVRNPMISGVVLILFGEAGLLRSAGQLQWALLFLAINLVYIPLFEEPQLRQRFGASYIEYCRHVPRVIPRLRPWRTTND